MNFKKIIFILFILFFSTEINAQVISNTFNESIPTTNNSVYSSVLSENGEILYIGGIFTQIGSETRNRLTAINAYTGEILPLNISISGGIESLTIKNNILYLGGSFTSVGGQSRNRLASIDLNTNEVTSFNPNVNNTVYKLLISDNILYLGGDFTTVGGQSRTKLASINLVDGQLTNLNLNINDRIRALDINNNILYVGGLFTSFGGEARNRVAAVDLNINEVTSFNPNLDDLVIDMALEDNILYLGGFFTSVGGVSRNKLSSIDLSNNQLTSFNPNVTGSVWSLSFFDNILYIGGSFSSAGGQSRNKLAGINIDTGVANYFNPSFVNSSDTIRTLNFSNNNFYVGGTFSTIGGQSRPYFAGFSINLPPEATDVSISGIPNVGQILTGTYTYEDNEDDIEGDSTYRWLRDDVAIDGAESLTYTLVNEDLNKNIKFEVTPIAETGDTEGEAVESSALLIIEKTEERRNVSTGTSLLYRQNFLYQQNLLNQNNIKENIIKNLNLGFNRILKIGNTGEDIRNLQIYLNNKGFTISTIGPGSIGKETNYFGPLTKKAVIQFQKANNLIQDGIVGPKTKLYLK